MNGINNHQEWFTCISVPTHVALQLPISVWLVENSCFLFTQTPRLSIICKDSPSLQKGEKQGPLQWNGANPCFPPSQAAASRPSSRLLHAHKWSRIIWYFLFFDTLNAFLFFVFSFICSETEFTVCGLALKVI